MGILRPLDFEVAWAQPRICVRNPEAARPAIALPRKDLLFMRLVMLILILILNSAGRALCGDIGGTGVGCQRVSCICILPILK